MNDWVRSLELLSYYSSCLLGPLVVVGFALLVYGLSNRKQLPPQEQLRERLRAVRLGAAFFFIIGGFVMLALLADVVGWYSIPEEASVGWIRIESAIGWLLLGLLPFAIGYGLWHLKQWALAAFALFFVTIVPGLLSQPLDGHNLPMALSFASVALNLAYLWRARQFT